MDRDRELCTKASRRRPKQKSGWTKRSRIDRGHPEEQIQLVPERGKYIRSVFEAQGIDDDDAPREDRRDPLGKFY